MATLDELRARWETKRENKKEHHYDYEVPGFNGDLVIRFGPAAYEQIRAYQTAVSDARTELEADADVIVNACLEILRRVDGGELEPLTEGETTTFSTLAETWGLETDTARGAVFGLFDSCASPEQAVSECAGQLILWTRSVDYQVEEELVGESKGGPTSPEPPDSSTSA